MAETLTHPAVKDWGVDSAPESRPGVPMEAEMPPLTSSPSKQVPTVPIVHKRVELEGLTQTFGTSCPPRGLSGLLRRRAYRVPDNRLSHWMMLIMADRVDVAEGLMADVVKRNPAALLVTVGVAMAAIVYLRRRERFNGAWS